MVCRARSTQTLFRRVYTDSLNVIGMRRMSTVVVPFCKRVRRGTGNEANMLHDDARLGNDGTADRTRAVWTHSPPPCPLARFLGPPCLGGPLAAAATHPGLLGAPLAGILLLAPTYVSASQTCSVAYDTPARGRGRANRRPFRF